MPARRPTGYPTRHFLFAIPILASLAAAGCGNGKIKTYPVSGSITVDGKPYPGARLMLVPQGGTEKFQKERPIGVTDEQGNFQLTTFQKHDGAPAGDYLVMVRQLAPSSREEAESWGKRPRLDRKYKKPTTSGLTITVNNEPTDLPPLNL